MLRPSRAAGLIFTHFTNARAAACRLSLLLYYSIGKGKIGGSGFIRRVIEEVVIIYFPLREKPGENSVESVENSVENVENHLKWVKPFHIPQDHVKIM